MGKIGRQGDVRRASRQQRGAPAQLLQLLPSSASCQPPAPPAANQTTPHGSQPQSRHPSPGAHSGASSPPSASAAFAAATSSGWDRAWDPTTNTASFSSLTGSTVSLMTHRMSKLQQGEQKRGPRSASVRRALLLHAVPLRIQRVLGQSAPHVLAEHLAPTRQPTAPTHPTPVTGTSQQAPSSPRQERVGKYPI